MTSCLMTSAKRLIFAFSGPMLARAILAASVVLSAALGGAAPAHPADTSGKPLTHEVPRIILGIYDGRDGAQLEFTRLHRLAEMPLNHLGLVVRYHDIQDGLPPPESLEGVRGVLSWLTSDNMPDPEGYLEWASHVIDQGYPFVVFGQLGVFRTTKGPVTPPHRINGFLNRLGLELGGSYVGVTYDVSAVVKDAAMVEFERPLPQALPAYEQIKRIDPRVTSYLVLRKANNPDTDSHLVTLGPAGGYAATGYIDKTFEDTLFLQWHLNPFDYFRAAFGTDGLPKPDVTTLSGRRIYYSHIDGDGWRNQTELAEYRDREDPVLSARVILERAIKPYPDLPVTVAPIAADLDKDWYGDENALSIARDAFAEHQVEAGTHTYTHPFKWQFFQDYRPEKEFPFLKKYGGDAAQNYSAYSEFDQSGALAGAPASKDDLTDFEVPRAYGNFPYDLDQEIGGSIAFIAQLLPPGKKVELVQWSGNCQPYEAALNASRQAGVRNINGGDSRFDADFPSHTSVPPIGRPVGAARQIYASNSNENTYTEEWRNRFFGFKYLPVTFRNTGTPRRLKPLNIYYHMYSGQKLASLRALISNLEYARQQEIAPVAASHYAAIGDGFYSTRFVTAGANRWEVQDRGALQTVRFDHAAKKAVDFARSHGVIGQRHHQGSLYVALDAAVGTPVVALKIGSPISSAKIEISSVPVLENARWRIWDVQDRGNQLNFTAQGFGDGEFAWAVHVRGIYELSTQSGAKTWTGRGAVGADGMLRFAVPRSAIEPLEFELRRIDPPTRQASADVTGGQGDLGGAP